MAASAAVAVRTRHHGEHSNPLSVRSTPQSSVMSPTSPKIPSRPSHRRGKSHRNNSHDPLTDIRRVFQKALPRQWGATADFKRLSRDFFGVAIGFNHAHRIEMFPLNREDTADLALEMAKVFHTADVVLLLHESAKTLFVVHTHLLSRRMSQFPSADPSIFLQVSPDHQPKAVNAATIPFMQEGIHYLSSFLNQTSRQVVSVTDFGWNPMDNVPRMVTFGDWLLAHPLCFLLSASADLDGCMQGELCWCVRISAEGINPENDHEFEPCKLPISFFADTEEARNTAGPSVAAIEDRLHSGMFDRLITSEAASSIWLDVSTSTNGPSSFSTCYSPALSV